MDLWQDTRLVLPQKAPGQWRNLLTRTSLAAQNGMVPLHDLFTPFPVALLQGEI
jgi:maltooligosyltrehalose synthase